MYFLPRFVCLIFIAKTCLTWEESGPDLEWEKKMQIIRVEKLLVTLNKQVEDILDDTQGLSASTTEASIPVDLPTTTGDSMVLESRNSLDGKDPKFSTVLDELQNLEDQVNEAIRNLTNERRYPFSTMLRPVVQNISVLRTNLTLMQNRLLGLAALSNIAKQVQSLTEEIGKVLNEEPESKGKGKKKVVRVKSQIKNDMRPILGSLSWVKD